MDCGPNQIEMDRDVEGASDRNMVLSDRRTATKRRIEEGQMYMAPNMNIELHHDRLTDVMFVEVRKVGQGECVEVIDVGTPLGFPGQIQIRINRQNEIFYGMTIQNFGGFKRKLLWRYRMWSINRAIQLLVSTLLAGLRVDQNLRSHPALG